MLTLAAVVHANGSAVWASDGLTISRTGAGQYTVSVTPGTFSADAIPMFMPLSGNLISVASDWRTSAQVVFSADTAFHFVMVQVRPQ
jgi:hypothetical protein